ncbi:hypothetical protein ACPPVU_22800 [Mucilaginibacter sp. McL0603]|uniref:hypothetical protein n=1 Tax=Mucilaginibacter sp. McL0603 TaxID=3415670 RepID=UPI003CEDF74B
MVRLDIKLKAFVLHITRVTNSRERVVTPEAIKLFSEEAIFNNIQHNADTATGNTVVNYQFQFSPIEKIVELYDEKVALLERLLASEREKVELLKGKK